MDSEAPGPHAQPLLAQSHNEMDDSRAGWCWRQASAASYRSAKPDWRSARGKPVNTASGSEIPYSSPLCYDAAHKLPRSSPPAARSQLSMRSCFSYEFLSYQLSAISFQL